MYDTVDNWSRWGGACELHSERPRGEPGFEPRTFGEVTAPTTAPPVRFFKLLKVTILEASVFCVIIMIIIIIIIH